MKKWYDSAVFYHIYPLGLCGAPKENKGQEVVNHLEELEDWLVHIKGIGCNALYIGPLFESVGHGYETTDYKLVDRRLGDNEGFKHFVKRSHELGIKIVLDGVFNHTGREFFAFKDLLQNKGKSKYKDWYNGINFGGNNEYNDGFSYEAWRGYNILVKLNLKNPEVKNYLLEVIKYWKEEFDIDGIRLDCADVLDFDFMKEMRAFCDGLKEDFWLMGEVIHGDYSRWVNDTMLHSVTDYELHKGIYSGHNDHNYFEIAHTVRRLFDKNGGICRGARLYSFVDNHDVDRIASKITNQANLFSIYTLMYGLPGIPSIYYGSEFGIEGKKANGSDDGVRPALNLAELIAKMGEKEEKLVKYITRLGEIKGEYEEITYGDYVELLLTNRQYAFGRMMECTGIIAAVNNDEAKAVIQIPTKGKTALNLFTQEELEITNGKLQAEIPAGGGILFYIKF